MRVLHISHHGYGGAGGAMAMRRLHRGLIDAGIESKILCARSSIPSPEIIVFGSSRIENKLNSVLRRLTSRIGLNEVVDVSTFRIQKSSAYLDADIVNLHCIYGFLSYLGIPLWTRRKPVVMTLTDMWSFTGHCYASLDCDRWKTGCGKCPHPDIYPPIRRDSTHLEWKLKDWVYRHSNLVIVTKSAWLKKQVEKSILNRFSIYHIPNGIDTDVYHRLDTKLCRSLLGIPSGKKVLMFAAADLSIFTKGGDLLIKSLKNVPNAVKCQTVLLLLGHNGEGIADAVDVQTMNLGYVSSDRLKAIAYSAADLFIYPTRADIFGNVLLESMACGTPAISFRVGGVSDLVRPGITGYLAEPESARDLSDGIVRLISDEASLDLMGHQCRAMVVSEYSVGLMVQRYVELYRQLLHENTPSSV